MVGCDNLFERSCDGRIVETYLHDGTIVRGYNERSDSENYTHLIEGYDGSIVKVCENGQVVVLSASDRNNLTHENEPKSYFAHLFCEQSERGCGVYEANLMAGTLYTKDDEGNEFNLHPR